MNISIFYEKQDSYKTIKDLTYHIGNVGVELKESNENRQDIDIAAYTYNDAKYIRKEIQVNNEELYFLYIYINLYANTIKELEYNLNKIEGIAQSKGMQTRRANFRQEECFLAGLPIMENKEIIKEAAKRNLTAQILIQVNIAEEETKFGLDTEELLQIIMEISKFPHVHIRGLMTSAPFVENPEENRCYFKKLHELFVDIREKNIDNVDMDILSMGMTNDYEIAIEEGATMVRVGTGIFGERNYNK